MRVISYKEKVIGKWGLVFVGLVAGVLVLSVCASVAGEKERMVQRLPVINQLKAEGVVGETNDGYLGFIGSRRKKAEVVEAENTDRRSVYMDIARKNGTQLGVVGRRRALQIVENARPGTWLQRANGSWYRK